MSYQGLKNCDPSATEDIRKYQNHLVYKSKCNRAYCSTSNSQISDNLGMGE